MASTHIFHHAVRRCIRMAMVCFRRVRPPSLATGAHRHAEYRFKCNSDNKIEINAMNKRHKSCANIWVASVVLSTHSANGFARHTTYVYTTLARSQNCADSGNVTRTNKHAWRVQNQCDTHRTIRNECCVFFCVRTIKKSCSVGPSTS